MPQPGLLRIHGEGRFEVESVRQYLLDLEFAYNSIYLFELTVTRAERFARRYPPEIVWAYEIPFGFAGISRGRFSRDWPPSHSVVASTVPIRDRLTVNRIQISSPGFWEFLGNLNPLEVIRKFINDRHERRKDREYKETAEARRLQLENMKLENEVLRERIGIARELGATEQDLAPLLNELVFRPLLALEPHQDRGIVQSAESMGMDKMS
jgi:hypothetical protein